MTSHWFVLIGACLAAVGGIFPLVRRARNCRPLDVIQNGCRTEFGPLDLRIEATWCSNQFRVFIEDHRLDRYTVSEEAVESSLESAKRGLTVKAGEYLAGLHDAAHYAADWRCS